MPSVSEVAERAGVSKSSAWLVLNNKDGVSDRMRERVLQAYRALEHEKGSADHRSDAPYVVLCLHYSIYSSTDFFKQVLHGIQEEIYRQRAQLRIANVSVPYIPNHISNLFLDDVDLRPDGVIMIGSSMGPLTERVQMLKLPGVIIGVSELESTLSSVHANEIEAGYQATAHLISLGHRRIAFVGGLRHRISDSSVQFGPSRTIQQRAIGYQRCLEDHNISGDQDLTCLTEYEDEVTGLIETVARQATGLVFANGHTSYICLQVLKQAGYRIPDDVSVVVLDDFEFQRRHDPPLTTIAYPLVDEGAWAVKMLLQQLEKPNIQSQNTIFSVRLIERQSCRSLLE